MFHGSPGLRGCRSHCFNLTPDCMMRVPSSSAAPLTIPVRSLPRHLAAAALMASLALAACSEKSGTAAGAASAVPPAAAEPATPAQPAAPAQPATPATPATPPPADASSLAASPTSASQQIPVNVQGVSPLGLTVRVKNVELTPDATVLTVSMSFSSTVTRFTNLADTSTYLLDGSGNKIMLKRPADNQYLRITNGQTLEGEMVFLGSLPAGSSQVELVINEGHAPDDSSGPGMRLALPLATGG